MNNFYVYEHWRPDLDVCFYVGKGSGTRISRTPRKNRIHIDVSSVLASHGMCVEVRMVRGELSEPEAYSLEKSRIMFWRSAGVTLANLTSGGNGGSLHSEESKEKMRMAALGRRMSPEARRKMSIAARKGQKRGPRSAEIKAKISASKKGRLSQETRDRIGAAQKGKVVSAETIEKTRATRARNRLIKCQLEGELL